MFSKLKIKLLVRVRLDRSDVRVVGVSQFRRPTRISLLFLTILTQRKTIKEILLLFVLLGRTTTRTVLLFLFLRAKMEVVFLYLSHRRAIMRVVFLFRFCRQAAVRVLILSLSYRRALMIAVILFLFYRQASMRTVPILQVDQVAPASVYTPSPVINGFSTQVPSTISEPQPVDLSTISSGSSTTPSSGKGSSEPEGLIPPDVFDALPVSTSLSIVSSDEPVRVRSVAEIMAENVMSEPEARIPIVVLRSVDSNFRRCRFIHCV